MCSYIFERIFVRHIYTASDIIHLELRSTHRQSINITIVIDVVVVVVYTQILAILDTLIGKTLRNVASKHSFTEARNKSYSMNRNVSAWKYTMAMNTVFFFSFNLKGFFFQIVSLFVVQNASRNVTAAAAAAAYKLSKWMSERLNETAWRSVQHTYIYRSSILISWIIETKNDG